MNKKYICTIFALIVLSVLSLYTALKHLENKSVKELLGSYTFTNTKDNLYNLAKIELINNEGEQLTIYYDGIWYFKEAADYFADREAMQTFFNVVNKSILLANVETSPDTTKFFNIKTYDNEGNLLDDLYFLKEDLSIVKYAGKNNFYKSSHIDEIPFNPAGWLPSPLFTINEELISAVNINGIYAEKPELQEIQLYNPSIAYLFKILQNIDYIGIIGKDFFDEQYANADMRELKLYLIGGLNYLLQVYNTQDGYYLKIVPERELIAKTEVNNIIKNKKLYYDDWAFLLNDNQGSALYNISLEVPEE